MVPFFNSPWAPSPMCLSSNGIILLHSPIIHPQPLFHHLPSKSRHKTNNQHHQRQKQTHLPCFNPSSSLPRNPKRRKKMEVEAPTQRSSSSPSSSPEFEFWMVNNPSFPPSNPLTADELFLDGVLLPLQLLPLPSSDRPVQPLSPPTAPQAESSPSPSSILYPSSSTSSSLSRRWKGLFKAAPEKKPGEKEQERNMRKKDRKGGSPDLSINLNIWPFTRSQSAGGRPQSNGSVSGRKVSSAPCSRSNSRGESAAGRRWAASPGRGGGLLLGRSSPVCQIRRPGVGPKDKARMWTQAAGGGGGGGVGAGVRVLNLNVNGCVGYGENPEKVSSRGDDRDGITGGDRTVEGSVANGSATSAFSFRALFSKKVY